MKRHRLLTSRWLPLLLLATAASAQDAGPAPQTQTSAAQTQTQTREALLEAEREAKSHVLAAPTRTRLERWLYAYDNQYILPAIFNGWKGLRFDSPGFPAGSGMKFGLGYSKLAIGSRYADPDLPNRLDVHANVGYSTRDYSSYSGSVALRNVGGAPVDLRAGASHFRYPQEDFFGLSQEADEENRSNYLMRSSDFGAEASWRPLSRLSLGAAVSYLTPHVASGTDDRFPSSEEIFGSDQLPGFEAQPDFFKVTARAAYDWRDVPLHPHRGGLYSVEYADHQDRDLDRYSFQRLGLELQQYVPLPNRYRTLALRAAAVMTDSDSDQQVPFYYMPTLGGHQALRGFREFRFRDENAWTVTAEYRWEAWWALDGVVFVDAGQVAPRVQDFKMSDIDTSYGFGLRFHSNKAFVCRLDFAFSKEGFIPLVRWEHVF